MYRVSTIFFFIFLIAVVILWQQGGRLYPYSMGGEDTASIAPQTKGAIEILSVRKLKNLKLDFSIFDDPIYQSLRFRDIPVSDVSSIAHGRSNPFAEVKAPVSNVTPSKPVEKPAQPSL